MKESDSRIIFRHIYKQKERYIETDRQTQTDRETDRQTERQTGRQREEEENLLMLQSTKQKTTYL